MAMVRFRAHGAHERCWEVEVPTGTSVLKASKTIGAPEGDACGGVCACSTCHVIVEKGRDTCNEATEDEEDQLEEAPGLTYNSRLACQCVPNGSRPVTIVIPNWNRNAVKETPH